MENEPLRTLTDADIAKGVVAIAEALLVARSDNGWPLLRWTEREMLQQACAPVKEFLKNARP